MRALPAYQRHPRIRLRRASGGGAAFLPDTVTTLELDDEAFAALALLAPGQTARDLRRCLIERLGRNFTVARIEILLRELAELGFVVPVPPDPCPAADGIRAGPLESPARETAKSRRSEGGGAEGAGPVPGEARRKGKDAGRPASPVSSRPSPLRRVLPGCAVSSDHQMALGVGGAAHAMAPPPESVHLQLNNVCNLRCPSCYVGLQKEDVGSLPLERLCELIDEWAEMGVFQLALGGGEPLMSPKLAPVARRAREQGIVPNVTTNGWLITAPLLEELAGGIGEIRLSLNDALSANIPLLAEKAALLRSHGTRFGFNLIVTRPNLSRLAELLRWACAQGAATVTLIRPKPAPGNDGWYARNALTPADSLQLVRLLRELEPLFERTTLAVDCAFSFLFHGRPAEELRALGVAGCPMGERFAVVTWSGDVYPCSHVRGEQFRAGNVATESFRAIWERGPVFARIRQELPQVEGHCGGCAHNPFCKGCRAVVQQQTGHWLAADQDCGLVMAPVS